MRCGCGECRACGTRGSDNVSSASDLPWMRGVVGVCEMCMCLDRGGVSGLGLGFINPVGTGRVLDVCVFR